MARLTWLGEDELHNGASGPSFCVCFDGIKFPKGQPVEVTKKAFIAKAKESRFFAVEDDEDEFASLHPEPKRRGRPPKVKEEESADV